MGCICCGCMKSGHNLPYATPERSPPDPDLFPYYFQNKQGLWLHFAEWAPPRDVPSVHAVLFIASGVDEHTARYDSVALRFARAGYHVFCLDNQGAGGSEGERLHVERFADFVDDFHHFRRHVLSRHAALAALPHFLLGHSMGGLIAAHVALGGPARWRAVALSGPALEVAADAATPAVRWIAQRLAKCCPKMGVKRVRAEDISTNRAIVELAKQDPFMSKGKLNARWGAEMMRAMDEVRDKMEHSTFPVIIVHGKGDKICDVEGSRRFIKEVVTSDKKLIEYDGLYHEVLTEVRRAEVLQDIEEFFNNHFP